MPEKAVCDNGIGTASEFWPLSDSGPMLRPPHWWRTQSSCWQLTWRSTVTRRLAGRLRFAHYPLTKRMVEFELGIPQPSGEAFWVICMPTPCAYNYIFKAASWFPSQSAPSQCGVGPNCGWVSRPSVAQHVRYGSAAYLRGSSNDFLNRRATARSKVENLRGASLPKVRESVDMSVSEIENVRVVTYCRSIRGRVVSSKDLYWSAFPQCCLHDPRHYRGRSVPILADVALVGSSSRVKIAQSDVV